MDFEALQHSVFLQALGGAILNSLWQCFIIWLIYETISIAYRTASARFRNNLSTLLLFFSFAWFLVNFISKFFNAEKIISIPANNIALNSIHNTSIIQKILSYSLSSLPYLSVAYIFLLLFFMVKLFAAYRYVYFIANKRLIIPPFELQSFASKVASQMRITKKIGVWISHHIDVPATIGFIKPVILIPVASVNNLSASQLEAIILHELSHIKRNDYIINIIISVIETILFFNPFVLLLSKVIKRERENCCDDFVLQYRYDPHSYASALLCLEQSRRSNLQLAVGAVSGKKQLLSRIKRITDSNVVSRQFNYGQKLLALLLITGIICSIAWLSPEKKPMIPKVSHEKSSFAVNAPKVDKTFSLAYKKIENAEKNNITTHNAKSQPVPFVQSNVENVPDESFNIINNETADHDILPAKVDRGLGAGVNLKQSRFFFEGSNIKLPGVINIPNFPFQNMSFKIDLGKIDLKELNKNLKEAYKQINALDWGKIQSDISENFPKVSVQNFTEKGRANFFRDEKALALSKLNIMKEQQLLDTKTLSKLYRQMSSKDSLQKKELALIDENDQKIQQQVYKRLQRQYSRTNNKDYFIFNSTNTGKGNTYKEQEEESTSCPKQQNDPLIPNKKNIKIIIDHVPHRAKDLNEKKSFQYFFKETTGKSSPENIISVQVSETP